MICPAASRVYVLVIPCASVKRIRLPSASYSQARSCAPPASRRQPPAPVENGFMLHSQPTRAGEIGDHYPSGEQIAADRGDQLSIHRCAGFAARGIIRPRGGVPVRVVTPPFGSVIRTSLPRTSYLNRVRPPTPLTDSTSSSATLYFNLPVPNQVSCEEVSRPHE